MMPHASADDDGLRAALHGVRGLLLDLDGVLVRAGKAIPGAPEAMAELERRGVPYLLVTNSSLVSRATLSRWARSLGLATPVERFQSALSASAELVRRELHSRAVYVITSDDARVEFEGLRVVTGAEADAAPEEVAAVVVGDSPDELTRENLDRAFRLVRGGAELIGMHRNAWWLTPQGPTLDAGAFLVGLEYATGRRARITGKPAPAFFRVAIERLAAEVAARGEPALRRRDLAMVGDDVTSDIGGGAARRAAHGVRADRQARRRGARGGRRAFPRRVSP